MRLKYINREICIIANTTSIFNLLLYFSDMENGCENGSTDAEKPRQSLLELLKQASELREIPDGPPIARFGGGFYLLTCLPIIWEKVFNFNFRKGDVIIATHPKVFSSKV